MTKSQLHWGTGEVRWPDPITNQTWTLPELLMTANSRRAGSVTSAAICVLGLHKSCCHDLLHKQGHMSFCCLPSKTAPRPRLQGFPEADAKKGNMRKFFNGDAPIRPGVWRSDCGPLPRDKHLLAYCKITTLGSSSFWCIKNSCFTCKILSSFVR